MDRSSFRPAPGDDHSLDELERALTQVVRALLRMGVPAGTLPDGVHIDRAGYGVLVCLDESAEALRLSELAGLLQLDQSTVSRQVSHLVAGGLVARAPDPADRRACRLTLSDQGRATLESVRAARWAQLRQALSGWSDPERGAFADQLWRFAGDLPTPTVGTEGSEPTPAAAIP